MAQTGVHPVTHKKKRIKITTFDVVNTILLLLITFVCFYPIYYAVIASFSDF